MYLHFHIFIGLLCLYERVASAQYVISSCPRNVISPWNKRDVKAELKVWWRSFTNVFSPEDVAIRFYDRKNGEYVDEEKSWSVVTISRKSASGRAGLTWQEADSSECSGYLYGVVKDVFTGSNLTYIYDDFETALIGRMENGKFKKGVEAKIVAERCNNGIKEIKTVIKNPHQIWREDYTRSDYIGAYPTTLDPFERKSVFVGESKLRGGDEGLFARRDFQAGDLVSYFGGLITHEDNFLFDNLTTEEFWDAHSYYIELANMSPSRWGVKKDTVIDTPHPYRNIVHYRHTLAHKINHQFVGTNTEFDAAMHPFHGPIACVIAKRPIRRGEELYVNYHYDLKDAPPWYTILWHQTNSNRKKKPAKHLVSNFFDKKNEKLGG